MDGGELVDPSTRARQWIDRLASMDGRERDNGLTNARQWIEPTPPISCGISGDWTLLVLRLAIFDPCSGPTLALTVAPLKPNVFPSSNHTLNQKKSSISNAYEHFQTLCQSVEKCNINLKSKPPFGSLDHFHSAVWTEIVTFSNSAVSMASFPQIDTSCRVFYHIRGSFARETAAEFLFASNLSSSMD